MPQLDVATFPPQLIWLAITFVVLYLLMSRLGLPRVGGVLAARRDRIEGDLEKAAQMKAEAEAVIAAYERALAEARQQAQIDAARDDRAAQRRSGRAPAQGRRRSSRAETAAAERRIAAGKTAALADIARRRGRGGARRRRQARPAATIDGARAAAAVDAVMRERA